MGLFFIHDLCLWRFDDQLGALLANVLMHFWRSFGVERLLRFSQISLGRDGEDFAMVSWPLIATKVMHSAPGYPTRIRVNLLLLLFRSSTVKMCEYSKPLNIKANNIMSDSGSNRLAMFECRKCKQAVVSVYLDRWHCASFKARKFLSKAHGKCIFCSELCTALWKYTAGPSYVEWTA